MKKIIALLLATVMLAAILPGCGTAPEETTEVTEMMQPVRHEIPAGATPERNPLKGLIPFQGDLVLFPHSMDWFYIPVNAVQTGMDTFDWTALEEKLDIAAMKGHQAVFRFYYDYPCHATGVPQFLIDLGLELRPYNEPEDLGGGGLCPDYEDPNLRRSMQNLIAAMGEKYDGDPRIGFITVGLLGFWGEWHNWPFDEDRSDDKPDWTIPAEVYSEVLTAFDKAFNTTRICVREPKPGIDNAGFHAGYHDDSFAFATLPYKLGGQDWSFGQRLERHGVTEKWMTECVGGEVYPPIQRGLFKNVPEYPDWIDSYGRQDWNACVEAVHPTWLMCDAIKEYRGEEKENAIKASQSIGYDLQVAAATYFEEVRTADLTVEVEILNRGAAPFYYNEKTWPVVLALFQNGEAVAQWKTDWDLSSIPADETAVSFTHTVAAHGLADGTYRLCMKVVNPLENGLPLLFSNEGQESDGWLTLGDLTVAAAE